MQKLFLSLMVLTSLYLSPQEKTLKGTWQYCGGKFNNKLSPAPKGYTQQRQYTDTKFDAFLLEEGEKPLRYESGNYALKSDTCLETQIFCLQAQNMVGVTVRYQYTLRNDTLILNGKLPNGAVIEDYWKRVK